VAHLLAQCAVGVSLTNSRGANMLELSEMLAGSTGLEPAASGVTGRRSNQLNYDPSRTITLQISDCRFQVGLSGPTHDFNLQSF
jgi:hypothetical protein